MPVKASKASVRYRLAHGDQRCGNCSMFRRRSDGSGDYCTIVAGVIHAGDTCNRWAGKRK